MSTEHVEIPLSKGRFALVDAKDAEILRHFAWHFDTKKGGEGYARTVSTGKAMYMHRFLMGCQNGDGMIIDHINGDRLDNRRSNLRVATPKLNALNSEHNRRHMAKLSPLQQMTLLNQPACALEFAHWVLDGNPPEAFWSRFEVM